MTRIGLAILILSINLTFSQEINFKSEDLIINEYVEGTLLHPANDNNDQLVIIIADSGPTDRNGNQNFMNNNAIKKLALALASNGIASFRYDKRLVKQIRRGRIDLKTQIDDFVIDAENTINYFSEQAQFKKIYILGHGQGSLVGMLAVNEDVDGFISVAGAGRSLDKVLLNEVEKTAPNLLAETKDVLSYLVEGKTTPKYPQSLSSIFDIELQPFMISWIKYDPATIISSLKIPILILNGTKDLQVSVEESEVLKNANKNSEISIIKNMNHVLFTIDGDDLENSKSYNEANRKISSELIDDIVEFIMKNS